MNKYAVFHIETISCFAFINDLTGFYMIYCGFTDID